MEENKLKNGDILLAEPFMVDPNFKRAVVLLCEHHDEGSIGFILNKPIKSKINELLSDFPEFEVPVYFGGPVQTDTIHYIHTRGDILDESQKVAEGIYWGGDYEKLKFLVTSKLILPDEIRFFVGYSGWTSEQLQDEISYGSWVLADLDSNYLFNSNNNHLWNQVMENKGNVYSVIAQMPDSVSWN